MFRACPCILILDNPRTVLSDFSIIVATTATKANDAIKNGRTRSEHTPDHFSILVSPLLAEQPEKPVQGLAYTFPHNGKEQLSTYPLHGSLESLVLDIDMTLKKGAPPDLEEPSKGAPTG